MQNPRAEPAKQRNWRPANPLFQLHNVIIIPHAADSSEETIGAVRRIAVERSCRPLPPVNTMHVIAH
jgi:D-3-phosphoglycerate dehydrogenase